LLNGSHSFHESLLFILIHRIIEQGTSKSAHACTDQGTFRIAADELPTNGSHGRTADGSLLSRGHAGAADEKDGNRKEEG
jgi:hypothetical protein